MNQPQVINVTAPDLAKAQVEFQSKVMQHPAARYEFKGIKGYAFPHGKSKPVIFRMELNLSA